MENKFDTGDLFTNGENYRGKISPDDFKVTTPKNPLLSITISYKYKESYQTLWPIPTGGANMGRGGAIAPPDFVKKFPKLNY